MCIIYVPDTVKFMTKEARNISTGIYDIVKQYQKDLVVDVTVLESAARRCTVAKYIGIAKQWVKVPKKKPYDEWVNGLMHFAIFFEKVGTGKGLSSIYKNRDCDTLVWTMQMIDRYMICARRLIQDWSSYQDMDIIISWLKYDMNSIICAFNIAEKRDAISIPYINAILEREQLIVDHKYNKEVNSVDKCDGMPIYRAPRTIFDILKEMEIAEQAKIDYENAQRKKEFDKVFMEEEDEQGIW